MIYSASLKTLQEIARALYLFSDELSAESLQGIIIEEATSQKKCATILRLLGARGYSKLKTPERLQMILGADETEAAPAEEPTPQDNNAIVEAPWPVARFLGKGAMRRIKKALRERYGAPQITKRQKGSHYVFRDLERGRLFLVKFSPQSGGRVVTQAIQ